MAGPINLSCVNILDTRTLMDENTRVNTITQSCNTLCGKLRRRGILRSFSLLYINYNDKRYTGMSSHCIWYLIRSDTYTLSTLVSDLSRSHLLNIHLCTLVVIIILGTPIRGPNYLQGSLRDKTT